MNNHQKVLLLSIFALWVTPGVTFACNAKGGKDCATAVANKTDHKVKLGKSSAPAANVGDRTVVGGVNSLGIPLSQYSSKPGYQLNGQTLSEFDAIKLNANREMTNPDGSLTNKAIAAGYTQILIPVLSMVKPGATQPAYPVEYYVTHNGRTTLLTERQIAYLIETRSIKVDGTLTQASLDRGFSYVMHYPTPTPNAVTVPNVVAPAEMKTPGYAVPGKAPEAGEVLVPNVVAPAEMKTPGYAEPGKTPVAGDVLAPNVVAPVEMKTPGYAEPGKAPVAGEVLAPNVVAPAEMKTPGYAVPGKAPDAGEVLVPNVVAPAEMKTPGYAEPGKVPVAVEVLAPNVVAPAEMKTPGYAEPGKAPVAGQVVEPTMTTFSAASTGGSHLVEVYQQTHSGIYRYERAQQLQHDEFHFVVVGFKLPE